MGDCNNKNVLYHAIEMKNKLNEKTEHLWEVPILKKEKEKNGRNPNDIIQIKKVALIGREPLNVNNKSNKQKT